MSHDSASRVPGRVSFVIPTRDAVRTLRACLESIRLQDDGDVEIVVVDNDSCDPTFAIAGDWADIVATGGPERGAQRNLGAALATGEVLIFADADMVFEPGVAREVRVRLARDRSCGAVVIPEVAFGAGFWARCRVLEKELYLGDGAVEAARGVRAVDFAAVGGYDESFVGGEDWDLADRVTERFSGVVARTDSRIWHDEGRIRVARDVPQEALLRPGARGVSRPVAPPAALAPRVASAEPARAPTRAGRRARGAQDRRAIRCRCGCGRGASSPYEDEPMKRVELPEAPTAVAGWADFFDDLAPRYDVAAFGGAGLAAVGNRELHAVREALRRRAPGRVLDAGAGSGRVTNVCLALGWSVTALDASSAMVARLRDRYPMMPVLHAPLGRERLPLADDTFDAVVSMRVLKYVDDLDRALAEIARVLRPNGLVVLEFANRRSVARWGYRDAPVLLPSIREFERALARRRYPRHVASCRPPTSATRMDEGPHRGARTGCRRVRSAAWHRARRAPPGVGRAQRHRRGHAGMTLLAPPPTPTRPRVPTSRPRTKPSWRRVLAHVAERRMRALQRGVRRHKLGCAVAGAGSTAAAFVFMLWFRTGQYYARGDLAPFVRNGLRNEFGWQWTHQNTGAGGPTYELVRGIELVFLTIAHVLGGTDALGERLFFAAVFALAASGAAACAARFVTRPWIVFAAGVLGAFNPLTMVNMPNILVPLSIGLGTWFTALVLDAACADRSTRPRVFALLTIPVSYLALNPPLLAVVAVWMVVLPLAAAMLTTTGRSGVRRGYAFLGRTAVWTVPLALWWLLPYAVALRIASSSGTINANTDVFSWSWTHAHGSLDRVLGLFAKWSWPDPAGGTDGSVMSHPHWLWFAFALPIGLLAAPLAARARGADPRWGCSRSRS